MLHSLLSRNFSFLLTKRGFYHFASQYAKPSCQHLVACSILFITRNIQASFFQYVALLVLVQDQIVKRSFAGFRQLP